MDPYNNSHNNKDPYQNAPQYGNNSYNEQPTFHNPGQGLASAAFFLSIGAIATFLTIYLPLLFAGLAIILALLSKGYGKKLLAQAKAAIVCGIGCLTVIFTMIVSTVAMIYSEPDVLIQFGKNYDTMWEQVYGQSPEEMEGISFEKIMNNYADSIKDLKGN